jgi:hypothetical protein
MARRRPAKHINNVQAMQGWNCECPVFANRQRHTHMQMFTEECEQSFQSPTARREAPAAAAAAFLPSAEYEGQENGNEAEVQSEEMGTDGVAERHAHRSPSLPRSCPQKS